MTNVLNSVVNNTTPVVEVPSLEFELSMVEQPIIEIDPFAPATLVLVNHSIVGTSGNDNFRGTAGADILYGQGGHDSLYGAEGNDWLYGGDGDDQLAGAEGNDNLFGHAGNDGFHGGDGHDWIAGGDGNDWIAGDADNDRLYGGAGADQLFGGSGSDYLEGGDGHDYIHGHDWNSADSNEYDILVGGNGSDTFVFGGPQGVFYQGNGYATVVDWDYTQDYVQVAGDISLYSLVENDYTGTAAADIGLYYQNDLIAVFQDATNINFARDFRFMHYGQVGSDYIYGGTGNDYIYGEASGGTGDDYLYGFEGNDHLEGDDGDDILDGGIGRDHLEGNDGNDTLYGGAGDDVLLGGDGRDRLDGYATSGVEYDMLTGGANSDTFVLGGYWGVSYQGYGHATITDWDASADYVEILGSTDQYSLGALSYNVGGQATDTALYHQGDLIAIFQDTTDVSFNRDFLSV